MGCRWFALCFVIYGFIVFTNSKRKPDIATELDTMHEMVE